jgi:AbrB family looped-hinge helix DNA binding protein
MKSVITSKYQTTIPKIIRDNLGLSVKDALEWKLENGKVVVYPAKQQFLKYRNVAKVGKGDITADIQLARSKSLDKYK